MIRLRSEAQPFWPTAAQSGWWRIEWLRGARRLFRKFRWELADVLTAAAKQLAPEHRGAGSLVLCPGEELKLPMLGRLDFDALRCGRVKVRYRALDPIWLDVPEHAGCMISLRNHVTRLCLASGELSHEALSGEWHAVQENLHLAASIKDISADTDIDSSSFMCSSVAEFDDANTEVAEKYLAGVIVFNLVWAAYESAVEMASKSFGLKQPRGARGRELLLQLVGDKHFPHLRSAVFDAVGLRNDRCADLSTGEMRRAIASQSMAGIGAEHLRQFRNAVTHGSITKPMPGDWGDKSEYSADQDLGIRQFHANTRLALLLIQILMRSALPQCTDLQAWLPESHPADLVLTQLHCVLPERSESELPLMDAPLLNQEW